MKEKVEEKIKALDEENAKLKEELKRCRESRVWKPKKEEDEYYYFIDDFNGVIDSDMWIESKYDKNYYKLGNCFKSEEEAKAMMKKRIIYTELKRLAEELNDEPLDWIDLSQCKFNIFFDYDRGELLENCYENVRDIGQIYCTNANFLDIAKDRIGEERLLELFS